MLQPRSVRCLARAWGATGRPSDRLLGEDDREIQLALLDGYRRLRLPVFAERRQEIKAWTVRRRAAHRRGAFTLRVGHLDLLFLPER